MQKGLKVKYNWKVRVLTATPLISLILFLIAGFGFNKWHPGWVAFLLIPFMPYILGIRRLIFTYPFVVLVVYLILGFTVPWGWHPGWIIFLTIPVFTIFTSGIPKERNNKKDSEEKEERSDVIDVD